MAGATGLEPAASCVTGRGSNQVNFDLVDGQGLISGAILCLLACRPKGVVTFPFIGVCACSSPSNSSSFTFGDPLNSWGETASTVDHRSVLKLKSVQVAERFGVPNQHFLNPELLALHDLLERIGVPDDDAEGAAAGQE